MNETTDIERMERVFRAIHVTGARMARVKLTVGEHVEVRCFHRQGSQVVSDWLAGQVVQADHRMAAIRFSVEVYSSNGWLIPDRTLWCAHGSPNLRRLTTETAR